MSIFNNIKTDMYNAMKAGEKVRSAALRTALSKIKDKQIEKRDSLNDDEIIRVAKQYGIEVPFKRPRSLSGDKVRNIEVVQHALNFMEKKKKLSMIT